jgi:ABC-type glycerol-3-phosphate transport system permease component
MRRILVAIAVGTAVIIALFPLYWAVVTSLRPRDADLGDLWLPGVTFQPTLAAWERLLALPGLLSSLGNSVAISVGAATLAITLAAPAAYAIGRLRFPRGWAPAMLLAFLLLRLLPPVVYLPSYLLLLRQFGLIDTVTGLVIVNATFNLPLAAIILTGAFREIPRELEEAAWVDGVVAGARSCGSACRWRRRRSLPPGCSAWASSGMNGCTPRRWGTSRQGHFRY